MSEEKELKKKITKHEIIQRDWQHAKCFTWLSPRTEYHLHPRTDERAGPGATEAELRRPTQIAPRYQPAQGSGRVFCLCRTSRHVHLWVRNLSSEQPPKEMKLKRRPLTSQPQVPQPTSVRVLRLGPAISCCSRNHPSLKSCVCCEPSSSVHQNSELGSKKKKDDSCLRFHFVLNQMFHEM